MLEQIIRQPYQRLLVDPIATKIASQATPNKITLLGGLLGVLVIPTLLLKQSLLAILFLLASGYCDTLDGTLARIKNQSDVFGAVLDIIFDRTVEFAVILGLFFVDSHARALSCLFMLGSILLCVTSFLLVAIFTSNTSQKKFYYSPGIIERPEAFIFFILMMIFPSHFIFLSSLFTLLVILTTIIRLDQFRQAQYK